MANVWEPSAHIWRGALGPTSRGVLLASIWGRWETTSASFLSGSMNKLVNEGQGLDLRKYPPTSPKESDDRGRERASRAEGGAARGPRRVGRGRTEPGSGGRAAREPSLLAGFRAAAQMFCERARLARGASPPRGCTNRDGGSGGALPLPLGPQT